MSTGRSRYSKMRSNRAREVSRSAPVESRLWIGNSSRVWRVVNATTVPIVIVEWPPPVIHPWPAIQYTSAGWMANTIWIVDITHRPAMRERTSMSAIWRDSSVNRVARSRPRPIVLPSMIPDTDSDSDTRAERSASRRWRSVVIRRRTAPTRRVRYTNGGTKKSDAAARRQSRMTRATIVAMTVVAFWATDVAVVVTTLSMPPMSLAMRDCTSPVRVRVKKASDILWRWRYTAARRSCMTRWPMTLEM